MENQLGLTVNALTGEETIAPFSQEELDYSQLLLDESLANQAAAQAKADTKAAALAKLAKLGLTQEEISAL